MFAERRRAAVVASLMSDGFAILELSREVRAQVEDVFREADTFFSAGLRDKLASATPELLEGFRAVGTEYSLSPERPDLCESFSHWIRNESLIADWIPGCSLHRVLREIVDRYSVVANDVLETIRTEFNPNCELLDFREMSYLQVNHYKPASETRDFLQDHHEDGHLFTLVKGTAKGLEILLKGEYVPVSLEERQVLIMPGSILTLMTAGAIQPLYHRVRCYRDVQVRKSLMFFVNPSMKTRISPWLTTPLNANVDIRQIAIDKSAAFGLTRFDQLPPQRGHSDDLIAMPPI